MPRPRIPSFASDEGLYLLVAFQCTHDTEREKPEIGRISDFGIAKCETLCSVGNSSKIALDTGKITYNRDVVAKFDSDLEQKVDYQAV